MSRRVIFNGAVLVRPGAATKIDASNFQNITLNGLGIVGLIGEAVGGEPRTVQVFNSPAAVKAFYKSGDLVDAAQFASSPSKDPRIQGGAQSFVCYKVNNSTGSTYTHAGKITVTSKQYGIATNAITFALTVGGSADERVVTISDLDDFGALKQEISPSLGATGKFQLQYTGAATVCTVTISSTQLTTLTASANVPADDLSITFADFNNLQEIISYINSHTSYTCTALISNASSFDPANLDTLTSQSIMTARTCYARNFDVVSWINDNSSIVDAVQIINQAGPAAVTASAVGLTGGTRGTSSDSNWVDGLTALRGVRINQLVPLCSANATTAQGTFTFAGVAAAVVAHAQFVSSTMGRNECQVWIGQMATKANLITLANLHNSEHLVLVPQEVQLQRSSDGAITWYPAWAQAVLLAGLRAGAPLGEPLTWKYVNCLGLRSDASWLEADNDDVTDLALNGITVMNDVKGRGFRVDKCITTFTKLDNDAYTEETIVQIWKAIGYDIRTAQEDEFIGRPGSINTVQRVPPVIVRVCEQHKEAGSITDSLVNGQRLNAYRDITVSLDGDKLYSSVVISPVPGINFALNTITLIPAKISV